MRPFFKPKKYIKIILKLQKPHFVPNKLQLVNIHNWSVLVWRQKTCYQTKLFSKWRLKVSKTKSSENIFLIFTFSSKIKPLLVEDLRVRTQNSGRRVRGCPGNRKQLDGSHFDFDFRVLKQFFCFLFIP